MKLAAVIVDSVLRGAGEVVSLTGNAEMVGRGEIFGEVRGGKE